MAEAGHIVLDVKAAAEYLGVNEQTVRRLARGGQIPGFRVGDSWRFRKGTLDDWVSRQESAGSPRRILIVDDDPNIRELLTFYLEAEHYQIFTAHNGESALEALGKRQFDLILLDLELGGMDGSAVLDRIRQLKLNLPAVLITAYPNGELVDRAMKFAPLLLLKKPIDREQLILTLRAIVKPASNPIS